MSMTKDTTVTELDELAGIFRTSTVDVIISNLCGRAHVAADNLEHA